MTDPIVQLAWKNRFFLKFKFLFSFLSKCTTQLLDSKVYKFITKKKKKLTTKK